MALVKRADDVTRGLSESIVDKAVGKQVKRVANIVDAIDKLDPETDFTGSGLPEVKALEGVLGYDITAKERDDAWTLYQEQ